MRGWLGGRRVRHNGLSCVPGKWPYGSQTILQGEADVWEQLHTYTTLLKPPKQCHRYFKVLIRPGNAIQKTRPGCSAIVHGHSNKMDFNFYAHKANLPKPGHKLSFKIC